MVLLAITSTEQTPSANSSQLLPPEKLPPVGSISSITSFVKFLLICSADGSSNVYVLHDKFSIIPFTLMETVYVYFN